MSILSCWQKVYIRCHSIQASKKKGAMMQKANVRHGKAKMDKIVRMREVPCVRRSKSLYSEWAVCGSVPLSMERKKVMKEQRRGK
jgi:hypothetical protein